MEKNPTLMRKGINELRKTSSPQQTLVWNRPNSEKIHPSKAFHAVKLYYEKQVGNASCLICKRAISRINIWKGINAGSP